MNDLAANAVSPNRHEASVRTLVTEIETTLRRASVDDSRQVATDVVAAVLGVPRSWPLMNRDRLLDIAQVRSAREAARKLALGAPFAYAVGRAQFRHLELLVDERVLIPRPETEVLVEEILARMFADRSMDTAWGTAIDIGTGSGAIALALATEGRFDRVIATDVSLDALAVAAGNAERLAESLHATVEFRHGSLLAPLIGVKGSVIVSNPPYVAFSEMSALPEGVRNWEPPLALLGGHDGMDATRAIIGDAWRSLEHGGLLALEVDERRASLVAESIMQHGGYSDIGVRLDLTGRERFVFATRD